MTELALDTQRACQVPFFPLGSVDVCWGSEELAKSTRTFLAADFANKFMFNSDLCW